MEGLLRSTRDLPPSHLRLKIESFSALSSSSLDRYESSEFEAGDSKWKLVLYPNGNKGRGIKDHLSLYLVLVDDDIKKKEVCVSFSLFAFDHIRNKYFSVQDLGRFHEMKYESGFDKFLPLAVFKNPWSGYLNNGTCVFGAEVFRIKSKPNGSQCLSMVIPKPAPFKYTWKMEKFSKLDKESFYSEIFTARVHDWVLCVYPKGVRTEKGNCLSLFLHLADSTSLLAGGGNVVAEFKLRVVDQVGSTHKEAGTTYSFNSTNTSLGWSRFLNLSELNKGTGYLVNDTCVFQVEIIVLGSSK